MYTWKKIYKPEEIFLMLLMLFNYYYFIISHLTPAPLGKVGCFKVKISKCFFVHMQIIIPIQPIITTYMIFRAQYKVKMGTLS